MIKKLKLTVIIILLVITTAGVIATANVKQVHKTSTGILIEFKDDSGYYIEF